MSVAFRRDSDEEHLEPAFELPIPTGPNLVTPRGLRLIEARERELEAALVAATDDAERKALKRDLRYWNTRHITAEVVPPPAGDKVEIGVRVELLLGEKPKALTLVGHDEADPAAGLIAYNAPISRAMRGARVGDRIRNSSLGSSRPSQAPAVA